MRVTTDAFESALRRIDTGKDPTLCVAWSGGLDSTVLLDLARRSRVGRGGEVVAVHVDHRTRPESSKDADFCQRVATNWNVPVAVESIRPSEGSETSEARLRVQRYAAIADAADHFDADLVLTAHQADDAVETALLNLVRGAGTAGLSSLAPRNMLVTADQARRPVASWPNLPIVRPLLRHERGDLRAYADERELEWVSDPTNRSGRFARNRLRRRVMPTLREEADSLEPLLRTLDNLASDAEAVRRRAEALAEASRLRRALPGSVAFETTRLADAADAEIAALLRHAVRELPGGTGWRRETLEEATAAIRSVDSGRSESRRISLGGAVLVVESTATTLVRALERGGRDVERREAVPIPVRLDRRSPVPWFDRRLEFEIFETDNPETYPKERSTAWFDTDALPDRLEIRGPSPGETFDALGLDGTKSVGDVLRSRGVSPSRRWRWPLLALPTEGDEAGECLWICGLRQGRRAAVDASTARVLEVRLV